MAVSYYEEVSVKRIFSIYEAVCFLLELNYLKPLLWCVHNVEGVLGMFISLLIDRASHAPTLTFKSQALVVL